jgi:RimJ/RimL family protein N-acetyltransferase
MSEDLTLNPISLDTNPAALAHDLAPGFGGDPEPAREMLEQTLDLLTRDPRPDPWGCYLASAAGQTVGTCAFKAAPDAAGAVEIAYMTFPAFERQGHATAMAAALVEIAAAAGAPLAIAHTLPEENASNRALRRNGFTFAGEVDDPEDGLIWRWEKCLYSSPRFRGEGDHP